MAHNIPVKINQNVLNLKESATLKINQIAKKKRAAGETVYHFGFGQSPFPIHPKMIDSLRENAFQKDYLSTLGLPELRKEIVKFYATHFEYDLEAERIIIGPGSKELIFQALFVLEGPVIVPAPSWVSYGPMVELKGKHVVRAVTKRENSYKLTAEELKGVCATLPEEQKILILTNPNNPTGAVYHQDELEGLAKVCREENVIVISDEIYALVDFTGKKKKNIHHFYPEGTIITAGLSKSHGAGGWRLGFLAAPEALMPLINCMSSMVSETFSAVSAPIQFASVIGYSDDSDLWEYVIDCNKIHKAAGEYMAERLNGMDILTPDPKGAFYVFADFEPFREKLKKINITTSAELAEELLKKAAVAVLPGSDFYMPKDSLTCRIATVDYDGVTVLEAAKTETVDKHFIEKNCSNLKDGCDALSRFLKNL